MNLKKLVSQTTFGPADRARKANRVLDETIEFSSCLRSSNFDALTVSDLSHLFRLIDHHYFERQISEHLNEIGLAVQFRLSTRMTSSGGMTTSAFARGNLEPTKLEIAISSTLLFESFRDARPILVTGQICENRLQALQRIMEHETIHLIEMLIWRDSSCSRSRFQNIARRFFGHRQSTHELITPTDTARRKHDIKPGDQVEFVFENQLLYGFVNRITRRATVLVPSANGNLFTDGARYRRYYVPVSRLKKIKAG